MLLEALEDLADPFDRPHERLDPARFHAPRSVAGRDVVRGALRLLCGAGGGPFVDRGRRLREGRHERSDRRRRRALHARAYDRHESVGRLEHAICDTGPQGAAGGAVRAHDVFGAVGEVRDARQGEHCCRALDAVDVTGDGVVPLPQRVRVARAPLEVDDHAGNPRCRFLDLREETLHERLHAALVHRSAPPRPRGRVPLEQCAEPDELQSASIALRP